MDQRRPKSRPVVLAAVGVAALAAGCGSDTVTEAGLPAALAVERSFGEVGTSPGQFIFPRAVDADGRSLWVIDKAARVQRLDPETGQVLAWWKMPDQDLGKPTGVTVGPDDQGNPALYVPDTHYQRVIVYSVPADVTEQPRELYRFGSFGRGPGQFVYPTDVAVLTGNDGAAERVYVSEYGGNDRVSVFGGGRDRAFLFSFGVPGDGAEVALPPELEGDGHDPVRGGDGPSFNRPQSIALDADRGRLIVADACNHRLGVFDLDGRLQRWVGSAEGVGREPGHFNYPYGLALMDDGSVLVSEVGNHRVQRVDPASGACLGLFGVVGRGPGELLTPWGVAARDGEIWVLDSGNHRVQMFEAPAAMRLAGAGGAP